MRRVCLLLIAFVSLWPGAGAATSAPAADMIDEALQNISTLSRPGKIGYATIWDGNKFVQCRRLPDRQMRCEAAGSLMQPSLARVLTGERLNKLAQLGWTLDPAFGNHVQTFGAEKQTDRVSGDILRVLVEAYDAKTNDIETGTAWVRDIACPPRAAYSQNLAGSVNDSPEMQGGQTTACSFKPRDRGDATLTDQSLDELRAIYGVRMKAEIQRLRLNRNRKVWTVFDIGIGYVQCMPDRQTPIMYCEAQSAESWSALSAVLTPERIAFLQKAGYAEPGRAPNYSKEYPITSDTDGAIAEELLSILHNVYGYNGKIAMKTETEQ